jgi:dATP pyrophosphohydrolase
MADRQHRRPESILVLVYTPEAGILVMRRREPENFWQSVTGSLHRGETPALAAARELREETGFIPDPPPVDCGISSEFRILPAWRHRFPPGTTHNLEHVFCWRAPGAVPVRLNPDEHLEYRWLPFDRALTTISSHTNRNALARVLPLRLP